MAGRLGKINLSAFDAEENLQKKIQRYDDNELPKKIGKKKKRKGKLRGQAKLDRVMSQIRGGRRK